jgi:uncharacterized protein with FMN-binding domain
MKRVVASLSATIVSLVLLLGFKSHTPEVRTTAATTETPNNNTTTTTTTTTTDAVASANETPTTTSTTAKKSSSGTKTITGDSIDTRWGPVQVKITMSGSTIKSIDVIDYPQNNNRDVQINSYAVPELVSQALSAQSANVDGVSGATYTTNGFEQSLQSALSKA